jgi:hypothetical protein
VRFGGEARYGDDGPYRRTESRLGRPAASWRDRAAIARMQILFRATARHGVVTAIELARAEFAAVVKMRPPFIGFRDLRHSAPSRARCLVPMRDLPMLIRDLYPLIGYLLTVKPQSDFFSHRNPHDLFPGVSQPREAAFGARSNDRHPGPGCKGL